MFKITKGEFELLTPDGLTLLDVSSRVASAVKQVYLPGVYKGDAKIQSQIVNLMVTEYNKILETSIEQIADNETIKTMLWQYGESHKLLTADASKSLTAKQVEDANTRTRAHKFLAERCLAVGRENAICNDKDQYLRYVSEAMVCADQIVRLSTISDQIRYDIMIHDFVVDIPSDTGVITIDGNRDEYDDFAQRLSVSNRSTNKLFPGRTFDFDEDAINFALEPAFSERLMFTFSELFEMLRELDKYSRQVPGSVYSTKLIDKDKIYTWIKDYAKPVFTLSDQQCDQILAGLTVFADRIATENRSFYNPNLDSRALKRCFFETTFDGRPHLAWVPELIETSFDAIQKALVFGEFPKEWRLSNDISFAVDKISNERGKWFEKEIVRIVDGLGIKGYASKKNIGQGKKLISLIPNPGELDFVGWSPKDRAIVLFEAKMLKWAAEPRHVRSQNEQFTEKDGFVEKLNEKAEWFAKNVKAVVEALNSDGLGVENPVSVNRAIISFEPLFAKYKVKDFPVVSIGEFVSSYQAAGEWPYTEGVNLLL